MKHLNGYLRIGPHPINILSIIVGSLLGDAHAERRITNKIKGNTRITFKQSGRNIQYLLWNWQIFSSHGYCSSIIPKLVKSIGKGNKVYFNIKFNTWTYSSFNFIYHQFYKNGIKSVPDNEFLDMYFTPLALATWIMDNGSKEKKAGILIHTNSFILDDVERLCKFLNNKYNLDTKPRLKNKLNSQWIIYIPNSNIKVLTSLISDYLSPDMFRKFSDS